MEFFQTLGSVVSDRWKARNYNEEVFPAIASQALAELPPAHHVTLWDVVRWGMTADQLPRQDDIEARFGNPPLTVYTGRKFRIEVLFWTQGIPAIHQHGFSGAFHVMHGSSIHSLWDFEPKEQIETRLVLGHVHFKRGEILLKGDSRPILAGSKMFHSTYHMDRPTISVVIRTLSELDKHPQRTLMPPTIAHATLELISTVQRQTQLLRMLLVAGRRYEFNEISRHLFASKDAYSIFEFATSVFDLIEDDEERQSLFGTARVKHRELIDALEPALVEREIGNKILSIHRATSSADVKFFLALLSNIPERSTILKLVEQRFFNRDPVSTVVDLIRKLAELDVQPIRIEDSALVVLKHLLMDHSSQDILRALEERYGQERLPNATGLRDLCSALQNSWLLHSLRLNNPFNLDTVAPTVTADQDVVTKDHLSDHAVHGDGRQCLAEREEFASSRKCSASNGYRCVLDTQPDSLVPQALRPQIAPRNGHTWIVNPLLRFSATGRCPDKDIPFSTGVTAQEPMVWVSDPVTSIVSPFVLGPALAPIVSTLQPGRELAEPLASDIVQRMAEAGLIDERNVSEAKRHLWRASLQRARMKFESGYVALGSLLHPFTLSATRAHFQRFIQQGGAKYCDRQVGRRWAAHNEPIARFMLHQLAPVMEAVAGVPVKPSYVYFASYYDRAQLARHTDREQCEYSMSMLIDYSPEPETESPWPLWLDTKEGPVAIHQRLGDTLIYRGRQLPHYREQLPAGHTSTHLFLHYVPQDFNGSLD